MKKLLIQIIFLMLVNTAMAQSVVYINGTITDIANGNPLINHNVYIFDSASGYYYMAHSDSSGFYSGSIPIPSGSSGLLYVSTYDCNTQLQQEGLTYDPLNLSLTQDFQICSSNAPCQANFYYDTFANRVFHFFDTSTGNPTSWNWTFGDGGTSTVQNPEHWYNSNGWFSVTLTISTSTSCTSNITINVYADASYGGGCSAAFTVVPDSSNTPPYTFYFIDQSTGNNITTWLWDFGDGTYQTVTYPANPNVTHTYQGTALTHIACLTIQGADSTCNDITCDTVVSGSNTGCIANFAYSASPNTSDPTQFTDESQTNGGGPITSWHWDFGDPASGMNNTSNIQNPVHLFSVAGSYNACLTIQGPDSSCYDITCKTIIVGSGSGCQADFTYYPDSSNLSMIHFIDQSVGNITSWTWDFGDGTPAGAQQNPLHIYIAPGSYTVCLTIHGADSSCYDVTCKTIIVGSNTGCQANFTYSDSANTYTPTQFTDLSTSNGGGSIISWNWNFGDPGSGASNISTIQNPVHLFSVPGSYSVCLTIHGADSSCYDVTCKTIIVGNNTGCQAMFTYSADPINGSNTIQFIDQSTGNPGTWLWSFGDSTYSTVQNPLHVYPEPGVYLACLTITANNGINCTSTFCLNVFVEDSVVYHQIYGQVFAGNFPLQLGLALIFSLDSNLNYTPYVDVCSIDSNGVYYFTMVPDGNYRVYAIPFDSNGYLPTYYGDVLNWADATVIALGEPNNPYNINLIQSAYMPQGPGSVGGQVNMGSVKSSMMDKMTMLLLDEAGHTISFDRVSESGSFAFPAMNYGTYFLYAEMSGITSDYVKVVLTAENPHADVVMTFEGKNVLGINNIHAELEAGVIYPNPSTDKFNLALNLTEAVTVKIEIFNQTGQVISSMIKSLGSGQTILTLSTVQVATGFYTLRISSDKGINLTRKLLITK